MTEGNKGRFGGAIESALGRSALLGKVGSDEAEFALPGVNVFDERVNVEISQVGSSER